MYFKIKYFVWKAEWMVQQKLTQKNFFALSVITNINGKTFFWRT